MTTAASYARLGARAAYERLALTVSQDDELLALLEALPPARRQPNLLFGVVRLLGGPVEDPAGFRAYSLANCQRSRRRRKPLAWTRGHGQGIAWFA